MILNRIFQPHESHLPYIQKFFIDYNLFGMSYLHVPLEFVSKRFIDDDPKFRKRSVSHLEVDFQAIYILNRLEINEDDTKKAANPGIESIWEDEKLRRNEMVAPVPLESSIFKVTEVPATESDSFYRNVLVEKLLRTREKYSNPVKTETISEESSNESIKKPRKFQKTFDTKKMLDGSTYAVELSQNEFTQLPMDVEELENKFLNMSELEDSEKLEENFLDMSEFIDHNNEEEKVELEDDSILAPLTQFDDMKEFNEPNDINESSESDDELFNALNTTVANMEIFSQFVEEAESQIAIPQLDGIDDEVLSPAELTRRNDIANNFFPQPGPSGWSRLQPSVKNEPISQNKDIDILNSSTLNDNLAQLASTFSESKSKENIDIFDLEYNDDDEDEQFKSFYCNKTMVADDFDMEEESEQNVSNIIEKGGEITVITPALNPPDPTKVLDQLKTFNLLDHINNPPIYSNSNDVTGKMDVGHHVLEIRGNRLVDLEEFNSESFSRNQLESWRFQKFQRAFGFTPKSSMMAKNFMEANSSISIVPFHDPPTFHDAQNWLKEGSNSVRRVEDESPVKEKRSKILMVLEQEKKDEESQEDFNRTIIPEVFQLDESVGQIFIPDSTENSPADLTEFIEEDLIGKIRRKRRKNRQSFSKRFQEIMREKLESDSGDKSLQSSPSHDSDETSISNKTKFSDQSFIVKNANLPEDSVFIHSGDLTGPSMMDSFGFKMKLECLQSNDEHSDLTILSMELHTQNRDNLNPNPEFDEISAIFYTVDGYYVDNQPKNLNGIITTGDSSRFHYSKSSVEIQIVGNEMDIFEKFFHKIREFDPDIFAGYEIETASWGYFIQRGYVLNMNLCNALSRMPSDREDKQNAPKSFEEEDMDRGDYFSEQKIPGRIMLDVWRLMKHEIALTSYTFENICFHVLHRRYINNIIILI